MTEQIFPRIKAYMNSQSFFVNDSWLRECIEYFFSQNQQVNFNGVQQFVKEQFFLNDLREINNINGCLPANLSQNKKITLDSKYTLQLLKLYDISVSKYKQLEKLRNVSNVNIEATNENSTQPWEPVGKRMLQLFLTDGIQEILAIEYKPIRILNDSLLPGLKVMIMGPVICRKGVILLEETNIAIREGEVSDLLIPNALENVLANALNLPLNDDPYNDSKKKEATTTIPMDFAEDFNIDFNEIGRSVEMAQSRVENNSNKNPSSSSSSSSTLSRIENNSNRSSSSTLSRIENNSIRNSSSTLSRIENNSNSNSSSSILSRIEKNSNRNSSLPPPPPPPGNKNSNICEFPDDDDLIFDEFDIDEGISSSSDVNTNKASTAPSTSEFKSSTSNSINFPDDDFDLNDVDFDAGFTWTEPAQVDKKKVTNTNSKKETVNFEQGQRSDDNISKQIVTGSKRSSAELSPVNTAAKIHCLQSVAPMQKPTSNRKITDFIGSGTNNKKKEDKCPQKVCDFITEILSLNLTNNPIRKSVKAKVTAIGKITKKDEMWILNGTILDQTEKLDVDFSSQFMENLLGLSVSEFNQMKKKSKTDPKLLESMKTLLLDGQKKLGELNSLIELELKKDAKPIVLSSKELSEDQIIAHNKRFKFL